MQGNNTKTLVHGRTKAVIKQNFGKLPLKVLITKLIFFTNATFNLRQVPSRGKIAKVNMIWKTDKTPTELESHGQIAKLPITSKLFENY